MACSHTPNEGVRVMSIQKKSRIHFPVNASRRLPANDCAQLGPTQDSAIEATAGGLRIGRF
jgi:hypothetical protein